MVCMPALTNPMVSTNAGSTNERQAFRPRQLQLWRVMFSKLTHTAHPVVIFRHSLWPAMHSNTATAPERSPNVKAPSVKHMSFLEISVSKPSTDSTCIANRLRIDVGKRLREVVGCEP